MTSTGKVRGCKCLQRVNNCCPLTKSNTLQMRIKLSIYSDTSKTAQYQALQNCL